MTDPQTIKQRFIDLEIDVWAECVEEQLNSQQTKNTHGHTQQWNDALADLEHLTTSTIKLDQGLVQVGSKPDSTSEQRALLEEGLKSLMPWRKGPFQIHGVFIDTEWRSDWKWERVLPHLEPLAGRKILDVGCGNGYHCWRMAAEGAEFVLGIDPTQLFHIQFQAIKHFVDAADTEVDYADKVHFLPVGIEDVPENLNSFDTVFSMGVLYHRRSPIDHLKELKGTLRSGGQLVLETLVIDSESEQQVLVPTDRYSKMRNVWFIPSVPMLMLWLARAGFKNVRLVDENTTSVEEQRTTEWMTFESLEDFLDPADTSLTVEGYPAPRRAVVVATA